MSLMERVRAAGVEELRFTNENAVEELKTYVASLLPPQRLAQLVAENPKQAESEIRSICNQIFQERPWLAGQGSARAALVDAFIDEVFGLGPLEPYLADESITEIMVNGMQSLYIEREGKLVQQAIPFANEDALRTLIDRIIGPLGRRIDESNPMVDARLAAGHRVNAVIPPVAIDGPLLNIRKFAPRVFTLQDLEERGTLDSNVRRFLSWAIVARKNIAVSGGTGSGKTTLLNALSCEIPFDERIITIEDSAELRFLEHPQVVRMEARPQNAEGKGEITIRDLVKNSLRQRPDRIIVGEVRGAEALDMLNAMNTGHEGSLTTLHSNSPSDAILRLSTMVRFAATLPIDTIEAHIGSALDVVVQIHRYRDGNRKISDICEVFFDAEKRACRVETLFSRNGSTDCGTWYACPSFFENLKQDGLMSTEELTSWMMDTCLLPPAA